MRPKVPGLGGRERVLPGCAAALATIGTVLVLSVSAQGQVAGRSVDGDGPGYQRPVVGECHQVRYDGLDEASEPSDRVPCARRHTARVIAVGDLPADTDWSRGSEDLVEAVRTYCLPAFYDLLGQPFRVIAKSAYAWSYWIPTEEQRQRGASWIRCDVNLSGGTRLLAVGDDPLLRSTRVPDRLRACLLLRDGAVLRTACRRPHHYRFETALVMPGKTYPGGARFIRYAEVNCPAARRGRSWHATWESEMEWNAGNHVLVCYRPATR